MSYAELLNTDDWKQKRNEILVRDNHSCKRCGISENNRLDGILINLGNNLRDKFNFTFFRDERIEANLVRLEDINNNRNFICKSDVYKCEIVENRKYVIAVNFAVKNVIKYPFNGSTIENTKKNIFIENRIFDITNDDIKKTSQNKNIEVDLEGIWLIEYGIEHLVLKNYKSLQVHHKCYRQGTEIWNQNDDEYITLCNVCHQIVHQNQQIPFYDNYGNIMQNMNRCQKCNGTGHLPHYYYFLNGVCFECNGFGYSNDFGHI